MNDNERIATLEQRADEHEKRQDDMAKDIKDIKDNLLKRPSWATLAIITFLSSACIGLLVAVIAKL